MSRTNELKEIRENYSYYFDLEPVLGAKLLEHYENTYQDNVFDAKTKRLIALCGSIIAGCKGCILGQVDHSINHGATAREILEVCSISMSLGGTLAGSQVSMVIQLLKERDMI